MTEYAYDTMDRVTNISWRTSGGASLGGFAYEYDAVGRNAWGNVVDEEIASDAAALASLRYRFQGREWSVATGLINFRMRWYDAETRRWLSKDPIGLSGGLNLYAFCKSSPMLYGDSLGLFTMQIGFSGTGGAGNGGTVGRGIVFGYSEVKGIQIGAYGMLGDGAYVSKVGGFSLDLVFSGNEDICDLKGVSQTVGGSVTIPESLIFGGQGGPNNGY